MTSSTVVRSIALALASTAALMMFAGCEERTSNNQAMESGDREVSQLQGGMGLLEVERALGSSGKPQEWGRRVETPAQDPDAWSAEWRLSCVYEVESTESEVVAVFTAWTPEEATSNPPDSAYRLVSWSPRSSTPTQPSSTLWSSHR